MYLSSASKRKARQGISVTSRKAPGSFFNSASEREEGLI